MKATNFTLSGRKKKGKKNLGGEERGRKSGEGELLAGKFNRGMCINVSHLGKLKEGWGAL